MAVSDRCDLESTTILKRLDVGEPRAHDVHAAAEVLNALRIGARMADIAAQEYLARPALVSVHRI